MGGAAFESLKCSSPAREAGAMLAEGSRVRLVTTQRDATVTGLLGEGGQGSVYLVEVDHPDGPRHEALKWYFPKVATARQRSAITALVDRGAPGPRFLWPTDIACVEGTDQFGYVMPLRPPGYVGLADLMAGRVDANFRQVTTL